MLQLPTIRTLFSNISCVSVDITSLLSFPLPFPYLGYRLQYSIQVLDGTGGCQILFISAYTQCGPKVPRLNFFTASLPTPSTGL